jgi:polyphosphate kinase
MSIDPGDSIRSEGTAEVASARTLPLFNRELSWLEFNRRVLGEAENPQVPLLDRVKFLSICSTNLDEFFMVRVGEIRDLIAAGIEGESGADRWRSALGRIRDRARKLLGEMYGCFEQQLLPLLKQQGIRIDRIADLGKKERAVVEEYFTRNLEPILTPLAIDPGHPFPLLANLSLNLVLNLESARGDTHVVVLKIPETFSRFFALPGTTRFVLLEDIIASHAGRFFPGLKLRGSFAFRVIRNSDISIKEDDLQDLLKSVETELRRRDRREVVWLEIDKNADPALLTMLAAATSTNGDDLFFAPGPLKLGDFMRLYADVDKPELKDPPFNPRIPAQLASSEDIFTIIRRGDVLLHRPYESFTAVVEFLQTAAEDPDVLAIKQTLYRTDVGSPIVEALATAAMHGKQVTAVVELQARFDEKKNITWARHLEQAGVQVVYGLVGIKTHCKICLVIRREGDALTRYVHLSSGNYNAVTARLYTDLDLFTANPDFGADAAQLMNLLTGFSVAGVLEMLEEKSERLPWKRFIVAPMDYHRWSIEMIDREIAFAQSGKAARIVAKLNGLVDTAVIAALYRASQAGVRIQLLVRGICCLVPGVPGVSENIEVTSVIDRFLEHSRIFRFENGGAPEFYISSGDWMPRNFVRRIETTWPILAPALVKRLEEEILPITISDTVKSWSLDAEGKYRRRSGEPAVRSQEAFISNARAQAVRLGPYDEIIRKPGSFRRKAKKKKR